MTSNALELKTCHLESSLLENAISERLITTSKWYRETSVHWRNKKGNKKAWTSKFISSFYKMGLIILFTSNDFMRIKLNDRCKGLGAVSGT